MKYIDYHGYKVYEDGKFVSPYGTTVSRNNDRITLFTEKGKSEFRANRIVYELYYNDKLTTSDIILQKESGDNFHYLNLVKGKKSDKFTKVVHDISNSTDEWKHIDGYGKLYHLSDKGEVFSFNKNDILNKNCDGKYVLVNSSGKKTEFLPEELIEMVFKNNPEYKKVKPKEKQQPRKINQCSANNPEEIIREWESLDEILKTNTDMKAYQVKKSLRNDTVVYNYIWRYNDTIYDLTGFEVVIVDNGEVCSNFKINKAGVVINKHNYKNAIYKTKNQYYATITSDDGKRTEKYLVHRLVAFTFKLPNPNNYSKVARVDGDSYHYNNLRWCSNNEVAELQVGKKIYQLDPINPSIIVAEYNTMKAAEIALNIGHGDSLLNKACKNPGMIVKGFKWSHNKPING